MDLPSSPPSYQQPPYPPPKRGTPVWVWIVVGCCGGCILVLPILAAILFPVFMQARESARQASCISHERQMALGILLYVQDYDEQMPRNTRWMDDIQPYVKEESAFHCPSISLSDRGGSYIYGYAFDSRMSGQLLANVAEPRTTVLLYDSSSSGRNASDAFTTLPNPPRHRRTNNIGYVDGHVKAKGLETADSPGQQP